MTKSWLPVTNRRNFRRYGCPWKCLPHSPRSWEWWLPGTRWSPFGSFTRWNLSCSKQMMFSNQNAHAFRSNSSVAKMKMSSSEVGAMTTMMLASWHHSVHHRFSWSSASWPPRTWPSIFRMFLNGSSQMVMRIRNERWWSFSDRTWAMRSAHVSRWSVNIECMRSCDREDQTQDWEHCQQHWTKSLSWCCNTLSTSHSMGSKNQLSTGITSGHVNGRVKLLRDHVNR